jgi:hypothetical protein
MCRWLSGPAVAAWLLAATATPGHAQFTTFTSRAAFDAAAGPLVTESFAAPFALVPVAGGTFGFIGGSATFDANHGGMTFGGGDIFGEVHPAAAGAPQFLRFTFAGPVMAFGADFSLFDDPSILLRALVGGATFDVGEGFFGVVSTTPFTTVEIRDPTVESFFVMDDLSFSASAVPEPGTVSLLLVGLTVATAALRRRAAAPLGTSTGRGGSDA